MTIQETLSSAGAGLGSFLTAVGDPLGNFMMQIGIAGAVVGVIFGIGYMIKRSISKHSA